MDTAYITGVVPLRFRSVVDSSLARLSEKNDMSVPLRYNCSQRDRKNLYIEYFAYLHALLVKGHESVGLIL